MNDLFDAHTRARGGDPWTSKAAAGRLMPTLTDKQRKVMELHRQHQRGLTNWELEVLCGKDTRAPTRGHSSTWRTRVSELVAYGLVVDSHRTKRIADSDDPRAERVIWIWHEYADPYLIEPLPEPPPMPLPPTNARLENGLLIHDRCAAPGCSKPAHFGFHVAQSKGHLGTWYCAEHRPK